MLTALLKTMRPRQWSKNIFIFAAIVFDKQLFKPESFLRTLAGFGLFCLISSCVYIFNDIADVEADRQHPEKKNRPIASGKLSIGAAWTAGIVLSVLTLGLAFLLTRGFETVLIIYFLLNLAYSKWLKHIPIVDVLILAAGFVLRVHAGVTLIHVQRFSPWLYVVMTLLALFLGFGKRRAELALLAHGAGSHRKVLDGYTLPLLDQYIMIVSGTTIVAYSLYTFSAPNVPENHSMMLTIPFVIYMIFRYLYLIEVEHAGGTPEEVLLSDRPFQLAMVLWALAVSGHLLSFVNASAPGKIILFGEHAVVYNRPALAVPVTQVHVDVEVLDSPRKGIWINAPGIDLHAGLDSLPADHPVGSVILRLFSPPFSSPHFLEEKMGGQRGVEINISSTIPVAAGLGSGAAVSVALIRALALHLACPLTDEQVNDLVYEIEKLHHGTPSGIDNTVITYGKPVYFVKGRSMETFKVGKPFTIVIGDTGIPAPTKESVGDVRRLRMNDQYNTEDIFNEIAQIVLIARRSIESGKPEQLGELMDQNHAYLQALTVSSPELDKLVESARNAGALGAKLSGGGRGGNMIALVDQSKAESVAGALISAGAKRAIITEVK